jgi:uncharacterized OB-fold protein
MSDVDSTTALEVTEYNAGLVEGRLLIRHCRACGENYHYPRPFCPFCMSEETEWLEASGRATLYAFTIVRRGPGAGSVPAFVTLAEGPTIMSTIVGGKSEALAIGEALKLTFEGEGSGPINPKFVPENL